MRFSTKLFLLLVFIFSLVFVLAPVAYAMNALDSAGGGPWWAETPRQYMEIINGGISQTSTTTSTVSPVSTVSTTTSSTTGQSNDINLEKYISAVATNLQDYVYGGSTGDKVMAEDGSIQYANNGALGMVGALTSTLFTNPPASSSEYVNYLAREFGVATPAYAQQGIGFAAFSPIIALWGKLRNIAYAVMAIMFAIIGIMIMFRKRIDPRTVMTIQEAIPRLILIILAITFSYAIVAILIDLMTLSLQVLTRLLLPDTIEISTKQALVAENIFTLVHPLGTGCVSKISDALASLDIWKGFGITGRAAQFLTWITVSVVFAVAALFIMFKIFFMLLSAYISIVISIIFAPITLLPGALPGSDSLKGWLKGLLSDLLIFPVTFTFLILSAIFQSSGGRSTGVWGIPPSSFGTQGTIAWQPPMMGGGWGQLAYALISFGLLFAIPSINETLKASFQVKPSPLGTRALDEIRGRLGWVPFLGGTLKSMGS